MPYISKHCKELDTLMEPVPPVMIASLARSGKTTALLHLFNYLSDSKAYTPIFVSFNGETGGFQLHDDETDDEGFLRGLAEWLLNKKFKGACSWESLEHYIALAPKPVVLLLDELNALSNKKPSKELAILLRDMFLNRFNRYLCFTSHWAMHVTEVLGGNSDTRRSWCLVTVPHTLNLADLRRLTPKLRQVEVALYCGLPGLIYSVKKMSFDPVARFRKAKNSPTLTKVLVQAFFQQFCEGVYIDKLSYYNRYTFQEARPKLAGAGDSKKGEGKEGEEGEDRKEVLVWPLCYASPFLSTAGIPELADLIDDAFTACRMPVEKTGLEWEYIARVAVAVVAYCASFRALKAPEIAVIGHVTGKPKFKVVRLPPSIRNPEQAQVYLKQKGELTSNTLILAVPTLAYFQQFDVILVFVNARGMATWRGVQMKHGDDVPEKDATKNMPGILLRGSPPPRKRKLSVRKWWTYLNMTETLDFLPTSLHRLLLPDAFE